MQVDRIGIRNLKIPRYSRADDLPKLLARINRPATRLAGVRELAAALSGGVIEVWTPKGLQGLVTDVGRVFLGATERTFYIEARASRACLRVADYRGEAWPAWASWQDADEAVDEARTLWYGFSLGGGLVSEDGVAVSPTVFFAAVREGAVPDSDVAALVTRVEAEYLAREDRLQRWPANDDDRRAFEEVYWRCNHYGNFHTGAGWLDNAGETFASELRGIGLGGVYLDASDLPQKISEAYRRIAEGSTP